MASNALELFNKLVGDESTAQSAIQELIDQRVPEGSFLEYKSANRFDYKDARETWSKALSAFANTDGGVMVWGVQCKKTKVEGSDVDLDVPTGENGLHSNALELKEKLADLVATATTDMVESPRIVAVPFDGRLPGCVVCYVPQGQNKPYRATFAGQAYYMRQPDRTAIVPHSLLRAMFYPRSSPNISVDVTGSFDYQTQPQRLRFTIEAANDGNASAHELLIQVEANLEVTAAQDVHNAWETSHYRVGSFRPLKAYEFSAKRALHPGAKQKLCVIESTVESHFAFDGTEIVLKIAVFLRDGGARKLTSSFYLQSLVMPRTVRAVTAIPETSSGA